MQRTSIPFELLGSLPFPPPWSADSIRANTSMLSLTRSLILTGALLAPFAADAPAQCVVTSDGSGVACQTLYAGQTIDAGSVCVEVVGTNLVVTYTTTGGWELVETHVWIGTNLANMPQTRAGNPKVGNFPYHSGDISGETSWTLSVPLTNLGFTCPSPNTVYYIAAHAALRKPDGSGGYQTETGWSDGSRFVTKGNWGTYSTVTLTCDCVTAPPPEDKCETAFAYGGSGATCFLDIDEDGDGKNDFNRWGWTNLIPGPGIYNFDIYAGAGQCDLSKGTLVGTLTVVYDGSTASISYTTSGPFWMEEVHLYVGTEILARDVNADFTVAPGQYPLVDDFVGTKTSVMHQVTGLAGGAIYVVAHAVVCAPETAW